MPLLFRVLAIAVFWGWSSPGSAQTLADFLIEKLPAEHREEATTLAICLVAEAGPNRGDHHAILYVIKRRAQLLTERSGTPVSSAEMARRYCRIFRDPPKHRLFLRSLSWAHTPETPQYAHAWRQAQLSVVLFLLGVDVDPCSGRALHWGSHADASKPPRGSHRVNCGPTRNIFWSAPRRGTDI